MKKWFVIVIALLLIVCGMSGCSESGVIKNSSGTQSTAYSIYYINAEETELVKSAYEPEKESRDVMVQELMQLIKEQEPSGSNLTLLPKGVYITTYDIHEKTLTIDFNAGYLEMDKEREVLVRGGIVKMFIQVPGIIYVHFTVEGKELTDSKGNEIGPMSSDTFVDQAGKDINSYQYTTLTLYFANEAGDKLIQEKRSVYYNSNVPLEKVVLDQLLKGPRQQGNMATLPSGVTVLGATSLDGDCYVNFDSTFIDNTLPVQEDIPIYSIVNSLADTCSAERVQISVNGDVDLTFRETMRLDRFYKKNKSLIEDTENESEEGKESSESQEEPEATEIVTAAPTDKKSKEKS